MDHPKITESVLVEVQFVTKAERQRSRTGEVAHIIYKYIRQLEWQPSVPDEKKYSIAQTMSRLLKQIHQRRDYASHDLMVNERLMSEVFRRSTFSIFSPEKERREKKSAVIFIEIYK